MFCQIVYRSVKLFTSRRDARKVRFGNSGALAAALVPTCALLAACDTPTVPAGPTSTPEPPVQAERTTVDIDRPGCYRAAYSGYGASQFGCGILQTSGDAYFDQLFRQEIYKQGQFFASSATVHMFNECDSQRASALSSSSGFILFGWHLANMKVVEGGNYAGVAQVLAHEYAHQLQFRYTAMSTQRSVLRQSGIRYFEPAP